MKTHFDRVNSLREEKEHREAQALKKHIVINLSIFIALVSFVLLGALIPGFFDSFDSSPLTQLFLSIIPAGIFAYWRVKRMIAP